MDDARPHALLVGHGPGVGDAVARAFAAEGHAVSLVARSPDRVAEAAERLAAAGSAAAGFAADAGDEASLAAAIAAARARFGDPGVLVYNAAIWRPGPVLALAPDDLVADLRVCAAGALAAARAVAPAMVAAGRGSILFTGGGFALHPSPEAPSLSVGKAAIRALALMLAAELASAGVRVGTVTIMGTVRAGTGLDPDVIARAFLSLHGSPPDPSSAELRVS